jgi:hypothetical protein
MSYHREHISRASLLPGVYVDYVQTLEKTSAGKPCRMSGKDILEMRNRLFQTNSVEKLAPLELPVKTAIERKPLRRSRSRSLGDTPLSRTYNNSESLGISFDNSFSKDESPHEVEGMQTQCDTSAVLSTGDIINIDLNSPVPGSDTGGMCNVVCLVDALSVNPPTGVTHHSPANLSTELPPQQRRDDRGNNTPKIISTVTKSASPGVVPFANMRRNSTSSLLKTNTPSPATAQSRQARTSNGTTIPNAKRNSVCSPHLTQPTASTKSPPMHVGPTATAARPTLSARPANSRRNSTSTLPITGTGTGKSSASGESKQRLPFPVTAGASGIQPICKPLLRNKTTTSLTPKTSITPSQSAPSADTRVPIDAPAPIVITNFSCVGGGASAAAVLSSARVSGSANGIASSGRSLRRLRSRSLDAGVFTTTLDVQAASSPAAEAATALPAVDPVAAAEDRAKATSDDESDSISDNDFLEEEECDEQSRPDGKSTEETVGTTGFVTAADKHGRQEGRHKSDGGHTDWQTTAAVFKNVRGFLQKCRVGNQQRAGSVYMGRQTLVFSGPHLFWRIRVNAVVHIYEHSDLDCLEVIPVDLGRRVTFNRLYVRPSHIQSTRAADFQAKLNQIQLHRRDLLPRANLSLMAEYVMQTLEIEPETTAGKGGEGATAGDSMTDGQGNTIVRKTVCCRRYNGTMTHLFVVTLLIIYTCR